MSVFEHERDGDADALIDLLSADNADVRRRAAAALGRLTDHDDREEIVAALAATVERADDDRVLGAAVDALEEHGEGALRTLIGRLTGVDLDDDAADWVRAKAFVRALEAGLPELRMAAANALGEIGDADALEPLVERFGDPDPRVRARAARACGAIGDPRATEPLTDLLSDPSAGVRREAADALGRIGSRAALQALLELYDDDSEPVRRIAVGAFGEFDNDRPVEGLIAALADDAPAVRRTAVYSLIQLLANVPTDRSHEIRERVADRLAAADDETVVDPLVEILAESSQPAQRRNTAWLLGRVLDDDTDRAAADALVAALRDGEPTTAQFAATSLADIGGTYVEGALLELLEDDRADSEARGQAAFALGRVGGDRARERLERLLDETDDDDLRQRAFASLSKLGGAGGPGGTGPGGEPP
jgi:HEAT repeat protein